MAADGEFLVPYLGISMNYLAQVLDNKSNKIYNLLFQRVP